MYLRLEAPKADTASDISACDDRTIDRVNLYAASFEYDASDPEGYRSGVAHVGRAAGGRAQTVKVYEVPPGQSTCPFHYEFEEEWLLVLEGALVLRSPEGEESLIRGSLICFAPGPPGAHKLTNRGDGPAVAMMWSSSREPAVAVYPDSDKIGVWPGSEGDDVMLRRADGRVDYWDGER